MFRPRRRSLIVRGGQTCERVITIKDISLQQSIFLQDVAKMHGDEIAEDLSAPPAERRQTGRKPLLLIILGWVEVFAEGRLVSPEEGDRVDREAAVADFRVAHPKRVKPIRAY